MVKWLQFCVAALRLKYLRKIGSTLCTNNNSVSKTLQTNA